MDMKISKVLKVHFKIKAELYTVIVCILQTVSAITKKDLVPMLVFTLGTKSKSELLYFIICKTNSKLLYSTVSNPQSCSKCFILYSLADLFIRTPF